MKKGKVTLNLTNMVLISMETLAPYWSDFLKIASIHIIAVMSPGPDLVMILRNTLAYSKRSGVFAALGTSSGILVHATYTLLGIGVLIQEAPLVFNGIRVLGASYLIYVGWRAIRTAFKNKTNYEFEKEEKDVSPFQAWRSGFITNVTNPMVLVLFISIFSSVVADDTPALVLGFFMGEIILISLLWFTGVAILFAIPAIRNTFKKMGPWLDVLTGGVLIGLAFLILYKAWVEAAL